MKSAFPDTWCGGTRRRRRGVGAWGRERGPRRGSPGGVRSPGACSTPPRRLVALPRRNARNTWRRPRGGRRVRPGGRAHDLFRHPGDRPRRTLRDVHTTGPSGRSRGYLNSPIRGTDASSSAGFQRRRSASSRRGGEARARRRRDPARRRVLRSGKINSRKVPTSRTFYEPLGLVPNSLVSRRTCLAVGSRARSSGVEAREASPRASGGACSPSPRSQTSSARTRRMRCTFGYALPRFRTSHPSHIRSASPRVLTPPADTSNTLQMLRDAMLDTARRVLDARRVVRHQQEFGVLAQLCYSAPHHRPGHADPRRGVLRYLPNGPRRILPGRSVDGLSRSYRRSRPPRCAARGHARRPSRRAARTNPRRTASPCPNPARSTSNPDADVARRASKPPPSPGRSHGRVPAAAGGGDSYPQYPGGRRGGCFPPSADPESPELSPTPTRGFLARAHLAAFYFAGAYYEATKRLAGVRYVFAGQESPEGRPRYDVLGVLLASRLVASAAAEAARRARAFGPGFGLGADANRSRPMVATGRLGSAVSGVSGSAGASSSAFRVRDADGPTSWTNATAAGSGDDDETVRALFIAARHAGGDAVRARFLLGVRRGWCARKPRVSALQGALPAAGARQTGK